MHLTQQPVMARSHSGRWKTAWRKGTRSREPFILIMAQPLVNDFGEALLLSGPQLPQLENGGT